MPGGKDTAAERFLLREDMFTPLPLTGWQRPGRDKSEADASRLLNQGAGNCKMERPGSGRIKRKAVAFSDRCCLCIWGTLQPEARWTAGEELWECGSGLNGKKVYETRDDPGKAVPLTATVRGRAEHGGQGLGKALCCCISFQVSRRG